MKNVPDGDYVIWCFFYEDITFEKIGNDIQRKKDFSI